MATLFLDLPDGTELECELGNAEITIGRGVDCDIFLDTESVSVNHATLEPDGDDENTYILTDVGSTNGTKVNGIKIDRAELSGGEKVKIGGVTGQFVASGDKPIRDEEDEEKDNKASSGPRVRKGSPPPRGDDKNDYRGKDANDEDDRPKFPDLDDDDFEEEVPVLKASGNGRSRAPRRKAHVQTDSPLYSLFFAACLILLSMLLALCIRHFIQTGGFFVADMYNKLRVIEIASPAALDESTENAPEASAQ